MTADEIIQSMDLAIELQGNARCTVHPNTLKRWQDGVRSLSAERDTAEANLERLQNKFEQVIGENGRLHAEYSKLRDIAEAAYSEMAFACHDLAGRRLTSDALIEIRANKLAKCADELRTVLDSGIPEKCGDLIHDDLCDCDDGRE